MTAGDTNTQLSVGEGAGPESRVGELLDGRYRVLALIGAGGMGVVYEGEHVHIGRRVAIKFVRRDLASHPKMLERFRFEARAAGQLASDHVASVFDFGVTSGGDFYLVMEKLLGETLAHRLARRQTLPAVEATKIIAQASRGAQAAHDLDIVHCDLKPSNLFISIRDDGSETTKLLDFGVARLLVPSDGQVSGAAHRAMGTPSYMSPEQASANAPIDARTDVYALGVILYQALSGELPHPGSDPLAIRCRIIREDAPDIRQRQPGVPLGLADIVHRALAREASQRYSSAVALAEALEHFVSSVALSATVRAQAVESLPETYADLPTGFEQEGNCASISPHAVALDVGSEHRSARRRPSLQRWLLVAAALVGSVILVGRSVWPRSIRSEAAPLAMGSHAPAPSSGEAQSSKLEAEGTREASAVATADRSSVESPAVAGNRAPLASRRRVKRTNEPVSTEAAIPSVAPAPEQEVRQASEPLARNYDKFVGF